MKLFQWAFMVDCYHIAFTNLLHRSKTEENVTSQKQKLYEMKAGPCTHSRSLQGFQI